MIILFIVFNFDEKERKKWKKNVKKNQKRDTFYQRKCLINKINMLKKQLYNDSKIEMKQCLFYKKIQTK